MGLKLGNLEREGGSAPAFTPLLEMEEETLLLFPVDDATVEVAPDPLLEEEPPLPRTILKELSTSVSEGMETMGLGELLWLLPL